MSRILGRAVTKETGETVMEMIGPPNAFSNDKDVMSQCLYFLSEVIIRGLQPDRRGGFLGGDFGYGAEFENDIFLMHPDYQDAECDCGIRRAGARWDKHGGCLKTCFSRLCHKREESEERPYRDIIDWLIWERNQLPAFDESPAHNGWQRQIELFCNKERDAGKRAQRMLAKSMGINSTDTWKCTCGGRERWAKWREDHPHAERCAIMLPNFWHKPSGLKITWYKGLVETWKCSQRRSAG